MKWRNASSQIHEGFRLLEIARDSGLSLVLDADLASDE
jgi:hypothetical protein